ncbi:MAG: SWIM zinc finger family protein, partial [Candidatus Anstonellales archaeon]
MRRLVITNKKELRTKCNYELLEITTIDENGVYAVKNCKKGTKYLVTIEPDTCSCEAYKFNGNDCKHINAVKNILREEEQRREERHMAIAVYKTE